MTDAEMRAKVAHIEGMLDTRRCWHKTDFEDFYQRDVVETLLPAAKRLLAAALRVPLREPPHVPPPP